MGAVEAARHRVSTGPAGSGGEHLRSALQYASWGWPVLLLDCVGSDGRCTCGRASRGSPGKHPRSEHGVKHASTDLDRVRAGSAHGGDDSPTPMLGSPPGLAPVTTCGLRATRCSLSGHRRAKWAQASEHKRLT
jgi:hypothetical protein